MLIRYPEAATVRVLSSVSLLLLFLLGGCSDPKWTEQKLAESKQRGDAIVDALFAYKEKHGQFPTQLTPLVPEFLPKVEPPTAGTGSWEYYSGGSNFTLYFAKSKKASDAEWTYSSETRRWERVDKNF
jgi:hypothetical protein